MGFPWKTSVFLLALIPLLCTAAVCAAFPVLSENTRYEGEDREKGFGQKVELTLLPQHFFVLRQTFSSGSRQFVRDMTGHWRQREGGAVLNLSNRHGLSLSFTVGGTSSLYGILPVLGLERRPQVSLHPVAFQYPTFTLMGTLVRDGSRGRLVDSATDRVFQVEGGVLMPLPRGEEFFADVELSFADPVSRLLRIRSLSRNFPSRPGRQRDVSFATVTRERTWWITFPSGLTISCVFAEKGEGAGVCEFTGKGLWLAVPYTVQVNALKFTLTKKDARMLTICEADELRTLLQATRSWEQEASSIVLLGEEGELGLLEDAARRTSRHFGTIGTRR